MTNLRRYYLAIVLACFVIVIVAPRRSPASTAAIVGLPLASLMVTLVQARLEGWQVPRRWCLWPLSVASVGLSMSYAAVQKMIHPEVGQLALQKQSPITALLGTVALLSVVACWGAVVRYRLPRVTLAVALDGTIAVIGVALVIMTVTAGEEAAASPLAEVIFRLVIPAAGIALTSAVVRLLRSRQNWLPSLWLLAASLFIALATQLAIGADDPAREHLSSIAAIAMMACYGLSVLHPTNRLLMEHLPHVGERESPKVSRVLLLGCAVLTIPFSAAYRSGNFHGTIDWPWIVGVVALLVAVGGRVAFATSGQATAEKALRRTVREQAAVAALSQFATLRPGRGELTTEANRLVVEALGCRSACVVERAMNQWQGAAGMVPIDEGPSIERLLTAVLTQGHAVGSVVLEEGARPAVSVVIGDNSEPFGALVAIGGTRWRHDDDTVRFLQSIAYVLGISFHQEQIEHELQQSRKLESVGRLAAGVAHEINTPIQFIGDNARFMKEAMQALASAVDVTDNDDLAFYQQEGQLAADSTISGIERVAGIVRAMRAFSHVQSSDAALADMNEALENALIVAGGELRDVSEVSKELGDVPLVECRIADINQVLLNLIVNAADAVREKHAGMQGQGRVHLATRVDGNIVSITVADNGPGIPESVQSKVFDQFFTTKEVGKGTGQGLAIARTIVRAHGGDITFVTSPDGTEFQVRLPVRAPRRPGANTEADTETSTGVELVHQSHTR